jgi:hypothetical protein
MSRGRFDEDDYDDDRRRGRDRYEDRDRGRDRRDRYRDDLEPETILGWGTARAGLGLNFIGSIFLTIAIGLFLLIILTESNRFDRGFGRNDITQILTIAAAVFGYLGAALYLIGIFLSGGSSSESGAMGWSIGTRVSILVFGVTVLLMSMSGGGRGTAEVMIIVMSIELGIVTLCWLMYLRQVASYSGSYGSATNAVILLVVSEILIVVGVIVAFVGPFRIDGPGLAIVMNLVAIGMGVWQSIVIGGTRAGLTRFLIQCLVRRR